MLQLRGYRTEITTNFAAENWFDKLKYREKQLKVPLPLFLSNMPEILKSKVKWSNIHACCEDINCALPQGVWKKLIIFAKKNWKKLVPKLTSW
jgi:hypothetical protein